MSCWLLPTWLPVSPITLHRHIPMQRVQEKQAHLYQTPNLVSGQSSSWLPWHHLASTCSSPSYILQNSLYHSDFVTSISPNQCFSEIEIESWTHILQKRPYQKIGRCTLIPIMTIGGFPILGNPPFFYYYLCSSLSSYPTTFTLPKRVRTSRELCVSRLRHKSKFGIFAWVPLRVAL